MRRARKLRGELALAVALAVVAPAGASTFLRVGLDYLVAQNGLIVVGDALSTSSYWNEPGTLILTDVRFSVSEVLRGKLADREITVTLPGGTVDGETIAVIGGAEMIPGNSYVLFLQQGNLPGVRGVRVVRDYAQGIFEIHPDREGARAVSQAVRMKLIPDAFGNATAPGGVQGLPLQGLRQSVHDLVERGFGREEAQR